MDESIFSQEWRKCLQEHYKYVIRNDDKITEESLKKVLLSQAVNFSDDDLQALYREATLRAEDLPDGFTPDMERAGMAPAEGQNAEQMAVQASAEGDQSFIAHPAECTCPSCMESSLNEALHDEEGQPLSPEALEERIIEQEEQADASENQMRLF
ncbi:MAG: hypothetical protein CL607_03105 [Anaerolineaceae bacterium]|nr:hypothetical protein [Anaerolineaceae bacterium]